VKLTIPAGALDRDVTITVATSSDPTPPPGYQTTSPVYVFGPDGLVFSKPVTITMAFTDDGQPVSAFWSTMAGDGFDDIGGTASAGQMTAQVTHFSRGFVGRHKGQVDDAGGDSTITSDEDSSVVDSSPGADDASSSDGQTSDVSNGADSSSGVDSGSGADSGSAASDASSSSDSSSASDSSAADAGAADSGIPACNCPINTRCCNGQCVDLMNSSTNCGACGVSCGAGTCSNGFCPNCQVLGQQCGNCCQGLVCGPNSICNYPTL
jgi:hypothetical protein